MLSSIIFFCLPLCMTHLLWFVSRKSIDLLITVFSSSCFCWSRGRHSDHIPLYFPHVFHILPVTQLPASTPSLTTSTYIYKLTTLRNSSLFLLPGSSVPSSVFCFNFVTELTPSHVHFLFCLFLCLPTKIPASSKLSVKATLFSFHSVQTSHQPRSFCPVFLKGSTQWQNNAFLHPRTHCL